MSDAIVPGVGAGLRERTVHLPCEAGSARRARRELRELLVGANRLDCLDVAELGCTELVTNAVLHAHTDLVLTIEVRSADIRVAVRDFNPALPVQRHYGVESSTGRGLGLIATIADEHGVHDLGGDGKSVWFTVGGMRPGKLASRQGEWAPRESAVHGLDARSPVASGPAVQLLGMPLTLWLAALEHHDALLRELAFHHARHPLSSIDLAAADRARTRISTAVLAAASGRPRSVLDHRANLSDVGAVVSSDVDAVDDVVLDATDGLSSDVAALQEALDAAESFALEGRALSRPGLPEIVAVRDWACEQIIAQLAGVEPAPWRGSGGEAHLPGVGRDETGASAEFVASVRDSPLRMAAADHTNRIIAISRSLAALLGWEPEELIGRRIVALVPPRLRDAHVAAFTRHLTTGRTRVIGTPVILPVLRADGSEIACRLLIDRVTHEPTRALYSASFDPVGPSAESTDSAQRAG
ncbi:PAS domain S-box protein [Cellulomonas sp. 179-A 4D5 NHS]|uniref:PAS domain S-box protein n=1 Tax=Cellulomonas sp. 179-A 4D5 NHS TaxID=3142378 RepID=UPI0039A111C2